jgi:hypothetical protein
MRRWGPYERLAGRIEFALDPANPHNVGPQPALICLAPIGAFLVNSKSLILNASNRRLTPSTGLLYPVAPDFAFR